MRTHTHTRTHEWKSNDGFRRNPSRSVRWLPCHVQREEGQPTFSSSFVFCLLVLRCPSSTTEPFHSIPPSKANEMAREYVCVCVCVFRRGLRLPRILGWCCFCQSSFGVAVVMAAALSSVRMKEGEFHPLCCFSFPCLCVCAFVRRGGGVAVFLLVFLISRLLITYGSKVFLSGGCGRAWTGEVEWRILGLCTLFCPMCMCVCVSVSFCHLLCEATRVHTPTHAHTHAHTW